MVCDKSVNQSGPCLEANGVPETASQSITQEQKRCPICQSFTGNNGCHNAQCPTQQSAWMDLDNIADQGHRYIRQAHERSRQRHAELNSKYPNTGFERGIIEGKHPSRFREDRDQVLAADTADYRKTYRKVKDAWKKQLEHLVREIKTPSFLPMRSFEIKGTSYIVLVKKSRSKEGQLAYLVEDGFLEEVQGIHNRQMPMHFDKCEHYIDRLGDVLGYPDSWLTALQRLKNNKGEENNDM